MSDYKERKEFEKRQEYKKSLIPKYKNVKFSDYFYDIYENSDFDVDSMKILQLEKIDRFINFYNKYNPDGFRTMSNGIDGYKESKNIFDKVVDGQLYIDKDVFGDPDNVLRNIIMIMNLDKPGLEKKNNV